VRRPRAPRRRRPAGGPVLRRRLLRPAVLIPAFVCLSLAAGVAYAAWSQLDADRADANDELIDSLPLFPGAEEIQRLTRTSADGSLPIPDEIVTSVLYEPPAEATQAEVVDFYVTSLAPEWEADTRSVTVEGEEDASRASTFRVDFSRGDDCVRLLTYGMTPGAVGGRTFALTAESGEGRCEAD
jgi:hypothetical protein